MAARCVLAGGVVTALVAAVPCAAFADVTASSEAAALAAALAPGATGAFVTVPPGSGTVAPNGVSSTALARFPTGADASYAVLTTGDVNIIDDGEDPDPPEHTISDHELGGQGVRGGSERDVTVLRVDLTVPEGANCLRFDFMFLSDEYPNTLGSASNDTFIAELGSSTWSATDTEITAEANFAFDPEGNEISINSTGPVAMLPVHAFGTPYNAATPVLTAATVVTPGDQSLYLSIFDQGDQNVDSAVFLDNLDVGSTTDPGSDCAPGARVKPDQPIPSVEPALTLIPTTESLTVGAWHTLIATLADASSGRPISSELLFAVAGANESAGVDDTDAAGKAFFTYLGTAEGTDTVTACVDANRNTVCEAEELGATATVTWTAKPHNPSPDPDPGPDPDPTTPTETPSTTAPTGGTPTQSNPPAALPDTGTSMGSIAASGLMSVVVGAAILLMARQRRNRTGA